ncbi:hypothetical protein L4C34_05960 [Vibrio profundum]|uniref:hypothetical protein n=1 Tax=Vibrio profundum TaxID=2910247 RepID=UPI003D103C50
MFVDELYQHAEERFHNQELGLLNDYRNWELCTPEVGDYLEQSVPHFLDKNLKCQAILTANQVQKMVIDKYGDDSVSTKYVTNEEEAVYWLREQLSHRAE